jgi:hypothetical protein
LAIVVKLRFTKFHGLFETSEYLDPLGIATEETGAFTVGEIAAQKGLLEKPLVKPLVKREKENTPLEVCVKRIRYKVPTDLEL